MRKWYLVAGLVVLAAAFAFYEHNQVRTSYVNGLAAYESMPYRQYIFERDCYIFKRKDDNTELPLVGDHAAEPDLPAEVDPKYVGADLPKVRILDIAHVGDRVKIASVRREQGKSGTAIIYEILFLNEDDRKYPRLDTSLILDRGPEQSGQAPTLRPEYLIEAVMH